MVSTYLQSSDYANYGVPNATSAQVTQASVLIDAYLQRPEGLIYVNGGNGLPCYMQSKTADMTMTVSGSITAGTNVIVTVTGVTPKNSFVGQVVILDRLNTNVTEAVVIAAVNGNNVTLSSVQFNHSPDALIEFDLVITEQRQMPQGRPLVQLFKIPAVNILGGQGRYGYGRRNSSDNMVVNEYNLLAAVSQYGGPPVWETFNPANADVDPLTGELWAPSGILLAYYTEIKIYYIAGYTYSTLPSVIKLACANIINAATQSPVNANFKSMRAGDTELVRFGPTLIDKDTQDMLKPFAARSFV